VGNHFIIPIGNKVRLDLEHTYIHTNQDKGKKNNVHLFIAEDTYGQTLGVNESGVNGEPVIELESAIVMDELSGEILFEKNAERVMPLASLTKIVAIKVFFETSSTIL